jgi:AcrR family transcriptional regulator
VYRRQHVIIVSSRRVAPVTASTRTASEPPLPVLSLRSSLPPVPSPSFDAYLDIAAQCFARHGVSRTSLPDIARELGVSRTTVYRRVRSIENLAALLLARDLHRLLETLPAALEGTEGPGAITGLLVGVVQFCRQHPVISKVLADEPELVGAFLVHQLPAVIEQVRGAASPLLQVAMDLGLIRQCDPGALAELFTREVVNHVIVPSKTGDQVVLEATLIPLLEP